MYIASNIAWNSAYPRTDDRFVGTRSNVPSPIPPPHSIYVSMRVPYMMQYKLQMHASPREVVYSFIQFRFETEWYTHSLGGSIG